MLQHGYWTHRNNLWHSSWLIAGLMFGLPTHVALNIAVDTHHLVQMIRFSSLDCVFVSMQQKVPLCLLHDFLFVNFTGLLGLVMGRISCIWITCFIPVCSWPYRAETTLCWALLGEYPHFLWCFCLSAVMNLWTKFYDFLSMLRR